LNPQRVPIVYKGRTLGVLLVVGLQVLVGSIHVVFGFWMLAASHAESLTFFGNELFASDVYSVYTILFSVLTLVFTYQLWLQKRAGWVGTVAVAAFVIVVDSLVLLDLPSVPGIPKFAGFGEIPYSVLLLAYLLQSHVREKYGISILRR
jgi:hypothetical protein